MKLALAQVNPTVGDLAANTERVARFTEQAAQSGADLVIFPELAISGYPPLDLIETAGFTAANEAQIERLAAATSGLDAAIVVGYSGAVTEPGRAANCLACIHRGRIVHRSRKLLLPTYDVFDEARYFVPGEQPGLWTLDGVRIGFTVCEDAWNDKQFWDRSRYARNPVEELASQGVDLLVNISASPYHMGKPRLRFEMLRATAARHQVPAVLVNQVGGNDQLVFDGSSFAVDRHGTIRARASSFEEDLVMWELHGTGELHGSVWDSPQTDDVKAVYDALVLGTRDYVTKCGFRQAIVGLSGGIDSSLTAVLAAEALGPENVTGVAMPGPYSSLGSLVDAEHTARVLGIRLERIGIGPVYDAFEKQLATVFDGRSPDVTEENLQARLRGVTLMALSNKFRAMVLTTGNKSELAVGYCTIYGDMCGGLAVISDVPKTLAYQLAAEANLRHSDSIPESVLTKPPSAELRPGQRDSDSLPPYDVLDPILRLYVEENLSAGVIAGRLDTPEDLVRRIASLVDRNEYKRQQAAPGLRVTSKAFGIGRRFPIAQKYVR